MSGVMVAECIGMQFSEAQKRRAGACSTCGLTQGDAEPDCAESGNTPASSSCITTMFTSVETEGRPVSATKCAVSRYSGSRAIYKSRRRAMGSSTCSRGRLPSCRTRRYTSSAAECKYTTWPRVRRCCRLPGRSTTPPPVEITPAWDEVSSSMVDSSTSRNDDSPSRAK